MPDGAKSQDLENLQIFREYVAANVQRWYRYINGPRGRDAKNGDVRLVVGCDKATSWGMAALSNMTQPSELKFKRLDTQPSSSGSAYTWEYSGMASVQVGPGQEEIDELRREDPDDSPTQDKYSNQCLFVRTLSVTLNGEDWENLTHGIGVGNTPNSVAEHENGMASPSPSNQGAPFDSTRTTSPTAGGHGTQRSAGHSSAMEFSSPGINLNRLTISVPPTATVSGEFERGVICFNSTFFQSCNPSSIINEILLKKVRRIAG